MLDRAKHLKGYKLGSLDGDVGSVKEFFFDDRYWTIRYLVADTGGWLMGRQVLISPYALGAVTRAARHIAVNLTTKQIENSPSLDTDKPVSRQFEQAYYEYFGWPMYMTGQYMWGIHPYIARDRADWLVTGRLEDSWDVNLLSTNDVMGHHIEARDGEIGHVADFIVDEETWAIRYLVVDTQNWWPGKKVLVSPKWIEQINWKDAKVFVTLDRDTIKESPEYSDESLLTREYETQLHQHYRRQGYWDDELVTVNRNR